MSHQIDTNRPHYRLIRYLISNMVKLFYPTIEIEGKANLPHNEPTIFVLNHPNGLLDPMILMVALKEPVSFLAKSTLFGYPGLRAFIQAFGAFPIFRKQDDGLRGGATGDAAERNEQTFARCRALLRDKGKLALFPEGITHSKPELVPLRTGAARIALTTESENDWKVGVKVVPVGLWYRQKMQFRSSVLLVVGEPFTISEHRNAYEQDERQTVHTVTDEIEAGLDEVVLQAENSYVLGALPVVASWTVPEGHKAGLQEHHAWTETLLETYQALQKQDPKRLTEITNKAQRYADTLQTLGIDDPWVLEFPFMKQRRVVYLILALCLSLPFALLGWLLSYWSYRLTRPVVLKLVGKDTTQIGTFKLIGGALFVLLGWLIEAILFGLWLGPIWGILLFVTVPALAYTALRWGEGFNNLRTLISGDWLRLSRKRLSQSLKEQRRELAEQIMDAVQVTSS
ncbi:MAG: lysophospholipid acyltransferase family protein [Chloroflexota bacterium]